MGRLAALSTERPMVQVKRFRREENPRAGETNINEIAIAEKLSAIRSQSSTKEAENASLQEVLLIVLKPTQRSQAWMKSRKGSRLLL